MLRSTRLLPSQIKGPQTTACPEHIRAEKYRYQGNDRRFRLQRKQVGIVNDKMHVGRHHHHDNCHETCYAGIEADDQHSSQYNFQKGNEPHIEGVEREASFGQLAGERVPKAGYRELHHTG